MNIPDTDSVKLAVSYIDKNGNKNHGVSIDLMKIQKIINNQALFTIELDEKMTGKNPVSDKSHTLGKINGLALYNHGDKTITFKSGNMAALTPALSK